MINHEFWRVVAGGLLTTFINDLVAVTDRDARFRLLQNGGFVGKWRRMAYDSLSYVVGDDTALAILAEVADLVYNPQLRYQPVPMVENAAVSGGDTLVADTPAAGFTVHVYAWDYTEFSELGALAGNSQPGAGVYVLATKRDDNSATGLPSQFLTIT